MHSWDAWEISVVQEESSAAQLPALGMRLYPASMPSRVKRQKRRYPRQRRHDRPMSYKAATFLACGSSKARRRGQSDSPVSCTEGGETLGVHPVPVAEKLGPPAAVRENVCFLLVTQNGSIYCIPCLSNHTSSEETDMMAAKCPGPGHQAWRWV